MARERQACAKCGKSVDLGEAIFLYSIVDGRNYGPFHYECSNTLTEEEDFQVRQAQYPEKYAGMSLAHFLGPNWQRP